MELDVVENNSQEISQEKVAQIYLGNVPWKASPEDISMLLSTQANLQVKDVRIVKEKDTGRSRGFAFVDIVNKDPEAVIKNAPELVLQGRTLTVKYANARKEKSHEFNL
ncbi:MAG: RNA-binding protein [Candidatus Margulisbacteria bacterium]|jgi:RNA recognition motif-containing protein|nr:RNA-binding protein [Candidatus Margulisiibacteriota bacterium]